MAFPTDKEREHDCKDQNVDTPGCSEHKNTEIKTEYTKLM